jgi:glutamine amidotransferase
MSNGKLTIVDYGVGNLYSVQRAFEVCGASDICVSSDPAEVLAADRVVLPGVGAFADGMQGLRAHGLDRALQEFARSGRPLLGICLGMQLLATSSEEFGEHQGLDLIPGHVSAIPKHNAEGVARKIPYVGWSPLERPAHAAWQDSVLASIGKEQSIYLVHSFHFTPQNQGDLLATYHYSGLDIAAAVAKANITGLQFHPEKSGAVGLSILTNFLQAPARNVS